MSRELMAALERQAQEGASVYDGRLDVDDAVVAPARRRVRRARRVQAAGGVGLALVVVAGGALMLGDGGGHPAPLDPAIDQDGIDTAPVEPLSAETLMTGLTARERGELAPTDRQAAVLCDTSDHEASGGANADLSVTFDECDAVWTDRVALEMEPAGVELNGRDLRVTWTVTNTLDVPLTIDPGASTVALLTDPDGLAGTPTIARTQYVDTSLWLSDTTRGAVVLSTSEPTRLEPGAVHTTTSTFTPTTFEGSTVGDLAAQFGAGSWEPLITVQVRIPSSDADAQDALYLEVSNVDPASALVSHAVFDALEPRVHGEHRNGAQPALDCSVSAQDNPRTADPLVVTDQNLSVAPACDAVWIPGKELLAMRHVFLDVDEVADTLTVSWEATNVSGGDLMLDPAAAAVTLETSASDASPTGIVYGDNGSVAADTLWLSPLQRTGWLSPNSGPTTVAAGDTLTGQTTFVSNWTTDAEIGVQVRVVRENDDDGSRELLLEIPWDEVTVTSR